MPKTRKTIDVPTPIAAANRQVKALIRKSLREKGRGGKAYEKSRESITKALQCGLKPGQAVEIEVNGEQGGKTKKLFAIQDNFVGDVAFKKAYVSHYDLVEIPRTRRAPNPELAAQTRGRGVKKIVGSIRYYAGGWTAHAEGHSGSSTMAADFAIERVIKKVLGVERLSLPLPRIRVTGNKFIAEIEEEAARS